MVDNLDRFVHRAIPRGCTPWDWQVIPRLDLSDPVEKWLDSYVVPSVHNPYRHHYSFMRRREPAIVDRVSSDGVAAERKGQEWTSRFPNENF